MPVSPRPALHIVFRRPSGAFGLLCAAALVAGCGAGGDSDAPDTFADPMAATFADPGTEPSPFAPAGPSGSEPGQAPTASAGNPAPDAGEPTRDADAPTSVDAARIVGALERLAATAFVDLAGALETGRPVLAAERTCLADHDASTGAPLMVLRCADPLPVGGTPLAVRDVEYAPDEPCLAAMGDSARDIASVAGACRWRGAGFTLDVEWMTPEIDGPGRRPRPLDGARLERPAGSGTLTVRNLARALTGTFDCDIDLAGPGVTGSDDSKCAERLAVMADRLERHARTGAASD